MIDRDDETGDGGWTLVASLSGGDTRRGEESESGESPRPGSQEQSFPGFEGGYYQRLVHRIFTRSSRDPLLFANSPAFRPASARASRFNSKRYST